MFRRIILVLQETVNKGATYLVITPTSIETELGTRRWDLYFFTAYSASFPVRPFR